MFLRILVVLASFLIADARVYAEYGAARRASIANDKSTANAESSSCALSRAGRYLAFASTATNLSPQASNGKKQIFLRDRLLQQTKLISISYNGQQGGNADSDSPRITLSPSDGNVYALFQSEATNLVVANGQRGIFLRNLTSGTTSRVSGNSADSSCTYSIGCYNPDFSEDARYVVYVADNGGAVDLVLVDRTLSTATNLTASADIHMITGTPAISSNGNFIVASSYASNLAAGDTNDRADVFVYNRLSSTWEIISIPPVNESWAVDANPISIGPGSISSDGRYVTFGLSLRDGATPDKVYVRDRTAGTTTLIGSGAPNGNNTELPKSSDLLKITTDGNYSVFFSNTLNLNQEEGKEGIYIFDKSTNTLTTLYESVRSGPSNRELCMSGSGEVVAFQAASDKQLYTREVDFCLSNAAKDAPGMCGCDIADDDDDLDGTFNCLDNCPQDATKINDADSDGDGALNCNDVCSANSLKTTPGICGCNKNDFDLNGNKKIDCRESALRAGPAPKVVKVPVRKIRVEMTSIKDAYYEVRYQRTGNRAVVKTVNKNKVVLSNLPKGSYTVGYRIIILKGGKKFRGPLSKNAVFKII